jgi:PAS domain S-box-containing protein
MPEHNEKVQKLLEYQKKPALILDPSGTVLAGNESVSRLLRFSPIGSSSVSALQTADSLIGTPISNSGLILQPGHQLPTTWTWVDVLDAAHRNFHSRDCKGNHSSTPVSPRDVSSQATDDFWDREAELSSVIECDIYYTRLAPLQSGFNLTMPGPKSSAVIQARANVYWSRCQGVFLIALDRPYQRQQPGNAIPLAMKHASCHMESSHLPSACTMCTPSQSSTKSESASAEITTPLFPYIMATCSTDGLVTHFSTSWYRFSGLTEEESLGAAWTTAMHPEDVDRTQSSWMEVLSKELSQWSTEARFRRGPTGKYFWFLIRAQPQRDATGRLLRWYTFMMEINEWVMARQEAERKRQSMIALFSNSDIMLWGVDKFGDIYLREGGLHWLPVDLTKPSSSSFGCLGVSETSSAESTLIRERGRLGSALEAILYGSGSSPIVEHREGDRWFRTMFVAERAPSTPVDEDGIARPAVRAALALTFEITDEKNQAALILENEKLAANEKAANEANELKSRFLANVSLHCVTRTNRSNVF